MTKRVAFTIDGRAVEGEAGQTIIEAADAAGIYIPRLCYMRGLLPHGSCRICTVTVNGREQAACTQPIAQDMVVESDTERLNEFRRSLLDMLFVEGNHYCMFCERSGNCELQALAYRFGITAPRHPYLFPTKDVDASHPDIFLDRNRCVLCGRCVNASKDLDGKNVFQFVERGIDRRVAVNAETRLADTNMDAADKAAELCPVGAILKKRTAYAVPVGRRKFDHQPIGSEIERKSADNK